MGESMGELAGDNLWGRFAACNHLRLLTQEDQESFLGLSSPEIRLPVWIPAKEEQERKWEGGVEE